MTHLIEPVDLALDQIEQIEKAVTRNVFQAMLDFAAGAYEIFLHSPDRPTEVGEDAMREALSRYSGFPIAARIYGTMDFKRASYLFLDQFGVRQALLIDAKAEKDARTATLQMSQTSLQVRQRRAGKVVTHEGKLPHEILIADQHYLTTTLFVHFYYEDLAEGRLLKAITIAALPNGKLGDRYVADVTDTIWMAGRNAPSLGEDFRVRLSFNSLQNKSRWRIQTISLDADADVFRCAQGQWDE